MNILICLFILSFAYDLPLASFYSKWATLKLTDVMGAVFLLAYLGRKITIRDSVIYPRQLARPLLAMFGIACASSIITFIFMHERMGLYLAVCYSGYWLGKLALGVICYLVIYEFAFNRDNAGKFLVAIWFNGILVSLYGLLQYLEIMQQPWGKDMLTQQAITSSLSFNHVHLGMHMAVIIFLTLGLFFKEQRGRMKLLYGLSLPLFLTVEGLSLTRGTWIGVMLSLIAMMFWMVFASDFLRDRFKQLATAMVILILALSLMGSFEQVRKRFDVYGLFHQYVVQEYYNPADEEALTDALETRRDVRKFFFDMILDNPEDFVLGRGFMSAYMRYDFTGAHQELLDILHDSGVLGLLVYLWLVGSMLKLLWAQMHNKRDEWQPLYYSYFFGVMALLINSLLSGFFTINHSVGNFLAFFLTTLSVIVASAQGHRQSENLHWCQFQPSSPGCPWALAGPGMGPEPLPLGSLETCWK
ncbi:MAG: hypothetical protein A2Y80_07930 [Deltaproteobacteria bacterium RBG_13_58_19]|nr:MAG: hypothetical protein A2Y80_07930 [Deltaproteobacteria bacterium RBG_13_58_19]